MELEDTGDTSVALEYSVVDIFLNNYMILVAGKFVSPLGNFRQNLHPSWINKLPSAPPGFGHDGAAPLADIGAQLRGGVALLTRSKINCAVYVGNGPKLEAEAGELHAVNTEGFAGDDDDEKVAGGARGVAAHPERGAWCVRRLG